MPFSPEQFVAYCNNVSKIWSYGQINAVTTDDTGKTVYCVEVAKGVFHMLNECDLILLPDHEVEKAKACLNATWSAGKIVRVAMSTALLVVGAAAPGLYGGAAYTSGLVAIGGSMVGGIVVVSMVPALMTSVALRTLAIELQNDDVTANLTGIAGVVGGLIGTGVAISMVSSSGVVVGLSGTGIMSGLAALSGGSIAAGGSGVSGGLIACVGMACFGALIVGSVAYVMVSAIRQKQITTEYEKKRREWEAAEFKKV